MKTFCTTFFAAILLATLAGLGFASEPAPGQSQWSGNAPAAKNDPGTDTSLLNFISSRRDRRYTRVPRQVLAFYYNWYGRPDRHGEWVHWRDVKPETHEIGSATHFPARGAYDSHDPEIIDWQIRLAKEHGLTGFICTWWGQGRFGDKALPLILDRAAANDFLVTLYWEVAPGEGRIQTKQAVDDLIYMLGRYGDHPAFLDRHVRRPRPQRSRQHDHHTRQLP